VRITSPDSTQQPETSTPTETPLQKEQRIARTPAPPPPITPLTFTIPFKARGTKHGELVPSGGGTFRKNAPGFSATVGRDGRVSFRDKPSFDVRLALPCPSCVARGIERWSKNPQEAAKKPLPLVIIPILVGKFDFTDWIMRRHKQDPYSAAKLQFLDRTRAQRMRMAAVEKASNLRNAVFNLRRRLRAVWSDTRLSPARRRALLFELWDECAESGSANVRAAATRARATIVAFIRRQLPAGSVHAYTDAELKRLNAGKKSRALFAPYER